MNKIEPKYCTESSERWHSEDDYRLVGLSPCGEYVSHWAEISCAGVENITCHSDPDEIHNCQCTTGYCPCGSFMSHKVSDTCPFEVVL